MPRPPSWTAGTTTRCRSGSRPGPATDCWRRPSRTLIAATATARGPRPSWGRPTSSAIARATRSWPRRAAGARAHAVRDGGRDAVAQALQVARGGSDLAFGEQPALDAGDNLPIAVAQCVLQALQVLVEGPQDNVVLGRETRRGTPTTASLDRLRGSCGTAWRLSSRCRSPHGRAGEPTCRRPRLADAGARVSSTTEGRRNSRAPDVDGAERAQ